jgi:hypothetical protein
MRRLLALTPALLFAVPFASCSNAPAASSTDGGTDATDATDASTSLDAGFDVPLLVEAAPMTSCTLLADADPVGLCVQKGALDSLHTSAFVSGKGAAASWSSTTLVADTGDGGVVPYTLDDTLAYAAAAGNYLSSAELYGDTTITPELQGDLSDIALQLETSFSPPSTEYSGELYVHLRTAAGALNLQGQTSDGTKLHQLADNYARAILSAHYFTLTRSLAAPDGGVEAGPEDAGHDAKAPSDAAVSDAAPHDGGSAPSDAAHDAVSHPDAHDAGAAKDATVDDATVEDALAPDASAPTEVLGIIGNPGPGSTVTYAPADVATAAYALLDMVNRHPTDPDVPKWLAAARASLLHLQTHAKEPTTGLFYQSLVASTDAETDVDSVAAGNPRYPAGALLADTQATFALAMVRAQYLVTSGTMLVDAGKREAGTFVISEAGIVVGALGPALDLPFAEWAETTMSAMNEGARSLWDPTALGYMDGIVLDGGALTTKSTRPNAFMAGALEREFLAGRAPRAGDAGLVFQIAPLVQLLIANNALTVPPNSTFVTVIPTQLAYFNSVSQTFTFLDAGPNPESYSTLAVSAAVEGLTEQLFKRTGM